MNEIYEYRRAPNPWIMRIYAAATLILTATVVLTSTLHWIAIAVGPCTAVFCAMLLPRTISGLWVDHEYLVLGAWHRPRRIPLDNIAYLRVIEYNEEYRVIIVCKNGNEEKTIEGDLPDIDTLSQVMAERGVALRDVI